MNKIYMDNHATTPVDERVLEAMIPFFREEFGNPSNPGHSFGRAAEKAVETARERVAALVNARPSEIVFTSGATESNNLALKGTAEFYSSRGSHIVSVQTEHHSVLEPLEALRERGKRITFLPVEKDGMINPEELEKAIREDTVLVSIMTANNETGVLQDIRKLGRITRERGILFHTDAAQAVGKVPFDVEQVDMVSFSAHKMYGPKGIGALYIREKNPLVRLSPQLHGGGQEKRLRSGTLNVPAIVGFGKACEIAMLEMEKCSGRVAGLRDRLLKKIETALEHLEVNGSMEQRLPGNLNISFSCVEGASILLDARDIALSTGAACTAASLEPSHVLRAMGFSDDRIRSSVRFGLGKNNTREEVDRVADKVIEIVRKYRKMSSFSQVIHGRM